MILKGKQRAHGRQLGTYLLKIDQNEHVEIHELRGFMSHDLPSALSEIDAVSKGTRAQQPFFSLSLNPPQTERVSTKVFEAAIEQVEKKLGLEGQPRAIVFHEKEGRRHAHAVWSRIDTKQMKAINLPHYKIKLRDVSRSLFLEHGWTMPPGLIDREDRNPLNYSLAEWQQARRVGLKPQAAKRAFQESWNASDSRKAFAQALLSKGFVLARGDRRGYVALDYRGEVYAVARYAGVKTKDARARLGDPTALPSIEEAKDQIATDMSRMLQQHLAHAEEGQQKLSASFDFQREQLVQEQRKARRILEEKQSQRREAETKARSQRLAKGLLGVWHKLTGRYADTKRQNERETLLAFQRDRAEKDELIFSHIQQRQHLNLRQRSEAHIKEMEIELLRHDIRDYQNMKSGKLSKLREDFLKASEKPARSPKNRRDRKRDRGFEPEL
ncbi:MAG: relaxase/mobilization nuclease domain-containing protein [Candidatus Thiodiazotropha taylori]|nr:relaxase/mobilization nuclease domain-containing protein [Candidatus Thiodiazotropha taylori]